MKKLVQEYYVSSQTPDDLNLPSCVAVVEDYDYEADNDQDNLT